ncbi:refilin-A-like [Carassius carassius]|uniref:refilin-A-like n=1 Tax=Carassius carassius TaxID=217509 RepID=UPI0028683BAB|nr:refilin-A-like [Carassius carassius]XP_059378482.1 refilin-A-like [Carassius carassius]
MVGHLHLQAMDESLKGKNREGLLDSPDSGLPPSPSPPFYSLSPGILESRAGSCSTPNELQGYCRKETREGKLLPYLLLNSQGLDAKSRMYPVVYGESIEVNPKPEKEIKFNSAVKYASDRHFRDQVFCAQVPTATSFSETVVSVHNCTWRSYKSEVHFEPRHRPLHFQSTTIVFPKHTRNTYRTTLNYNGNRNAAGHRRFVSTVRLESTEDASPCIIYTEDL